MSDFRPVDGEFTGRHMLIIMVAFFGVIIAVNLVMALVATRSWTGLVVENSYVASQQFNGELEAARQQANLGWQAQLAIDPGSAKVRFADKDGQAIKDLSVELALSRPTHEAEDRTIALSEITPGEYAADMNLKSGVWNAELNAISASGQRFRQIHRFIVKGSGS